jgi:hypothetical protein
LDIWLVSGGKMYEKLAEKERQEPFSLLAADDPDTCPSQTYEPALVLLRRSNEVQRQS